MRGWPPCSFGSETGASLLAVSTSWAASFLESQGGVPVLESAHGQWQWLLGCYAWAILEAKVRSGRSLVRPWRRTIGRPWKNPLTPLEEEATLSRLCWPKQMLPGPGMSQTHLTRSPSGHSRMASAFSRILQSSCSPASRPAHDQFHSRKLTLSVRERGREGMVACIQWKGFHASPMKWTDARPRWRTELIESVDLWQAAGWEASRLGDESVPTHV